MCALLINLQISIVSKQSITYRSAKKNVNKINPISKIKKESHPLPYRHNNNIQSIKNVYMRQMIHISLY